MTNTSEKPIVRVSPICAGITCRGCDMYFDDWFHFGRHICPQNIR